MPTSAAETLARVDAILQRERENFLRDTRQVLRFRTISGGDAKEQEVFEKEIPRCLDFLRTVAERMGFRFQNWDNRFAEITWEGSGPAPRRTFGIAAHIDVVAVGDGWSHDPFAGDMADGFIWGRGIQDDKGPLMMSLYGMYAAKEAGFRPSCDIRLIIGTTEETGDWEDIDDYIRERGAPDFAFTPDATFPITNGEKGMVVLEAVAEWPRTEADPETGLQFLSFAGGSRPNIVPDKCEVRLAHPPEAKSAVMKELMRASTEFTVQNPKANVTLFPAADGEALVTFLGKAAHGSLPHKGHNAVVDAAAFFGQFESLPAGLGAYLKFLHMVGAAQDGSALMIDSTHHFIGATTVNLGVATVTQTGGRALLNIRPTMGMSCATVLAKARECAAAFAGATGLSLRIDPVGKMLDAIYLDPESPAAGPTLRCLQEAYTAVTGAPATLEAIGGTTYSKAFPVCCAFGPILEGVDTELAHQLDERMSVDSVLRNARIYGLAVALLP